MKKKLLLFFLFFIINAHAEPKKMAIIITSYNNAEWYHLNIGSIFEQTYPHWRIIYVDDNSTDGTPELVEKFVKDHGQEHRFILIKNKTRLRALANLYNAVQLCDDDEIVLNYDGDDWLANPDVLAMINDIYQNPDIWITYGQFINWPTNQLGYCKELPQEWIDKQWYRRKWWMPGQLRTFYGWLFKQVRLKDLLFEGPYYQGQFFPANADLAVYYPMMEMAGCHYKFISEIIYIRNVQTPINDFKANKDVQVLGSKLIREKKVYPKLENSLSPYFAQFKTSKTDVVLFSTNPELASGLIKSLQDYTSGVDTIHLFYPVHHEKDYTQLQGIQLHPVNNEFKKSLLQILENNNQRHVFFAHDGMILNSHADFNHIINQLEHAFAYAFFLQVDGGSDHSLSTGQKQPMPALNKIGKDICAWAFGYADTGDWRMAHQLSGALYRKADIAKIVDAQQLNNVYDLVQSLQQAKISLEEIGLCFKKKKIGFINGII